MAPNISFHSARTTVALAISLLIIITAAVTAAQGTILSACWEGYAAVHGCDARRERALTLFPPPRPVIGLPVIFGALIVR